MICRKSLFSVGTHRAVYFWAGPGTVRMNRLKFMGAPNDEAVHAEAHSEVGAKRISNGAGFNWAYLMYDWGFPPEIEKQDWEEFKRVVPIYHAYGIQVFGYVQASNCVYDGSFQEKKWYAMDPRGNYIHYYTGRYMTCWLHPEWIAHLKEMIRGVVDSGADGVFFDNPWMGIQPLHFGGTWSGPAGCYCLRCTQAYEVETGLNIPTQVHPESDPVSHNYLAWRANLVTKTMVSLADYAHSLRQDILISINDYDVIMHPTYISHGIDFQELAACQDVIMIEDFALPSWTPNALSNNAITIRTARSLAGDTPITTNPYHKGIGFDEVFHPRLIQQAIAEAAACGTAMVLKGTEYVDENGIFTLITAEKYALEREAAKQIHLWLAQNADLYLDRDNAAKVGVHYPHQRMRTQWDLTAPLYFGICQTLTINGIPWRVVTQDEDFQGLKTLFYFDNQDKFPSVNERIFVPRLAGWSPPKPSFLAKHARIRRLFSSFMAWFYNAYFKYRWARRIMDGIGLPQWFLGSPYFKIPSEERQKSVINSLMHPPTPMVAESTYPVLIEVWQQGKETHIHLVNYGPKSQTISLKLDGWVEGKMISLEEKDRYFAADVLELTLDVYKVVQYPIEA
jgi:hypothetical protein